MLSITPQTWLTRLALCANTEVTNVWTQPYESDTGGGIIHRVALKRDEMELTCSVPRILIHLWRDLEVGQAYEFEVSRSRHRCYLQAVMEI